MPTETSRHPRNDQVHGGRPSGGGRNNQAVHGGPLPHPVEFNVAKSDGQVVQDNVVLEKLKHTYIIKIEETPRSRTKKPNSQISALGPRNPSPRRLDQKGVA